MPKDIEKKVLEEMRNPLLYTKYMLEYVENNVEDAFHIACRKKLSINQWKPDEHFGDQINEKTVLLTVRMFDLWETAIIDVLNKYLGKKFKGVRVKPAHDSKGDLIIKFPNNTQVYWEIKTTQGNFTGATHSASKCNNYILISFEIDKDKLLQTESRNKGFIRSLAVLVWNDMEAMWIGEPSKDSSWTSLLIPSEIKRSRPEIIVVGDLIPKRKWCEIKRELLVK